MRAAGRAKCIFGKNGCFTSPLVDNTSNSCIDIYQITFQWIFLEIVAYILTSWYFCKVWRVISNDRYVDISPNLVLILVLITTLDLHDLKCLVSLWEARKNVLRRRISLVFCLFDIIRKRFTDDKNWNQSMLRPAASLYHTYLPVGLYFRNRM